MKKLLVKNIGLLATPEGKSAHRGEEQGKIKFLKDAWVLIEDGIIASVGTGAVPAVEGAEVVDAEGHLVTPGLSTPTPTSSSAAGARTSWVSSSTAQAISTFRTRAAASSPRRTPPVRPASRSSPPRPPRRSTR